MRFEDWYAKTNPKHVQINLYQSLSAVYGEWLPYVLTTWWAVMSK